MVKLYTDVTEQRYGFVVLNLFATEIYFQSETSRELKRLRNVESSAANFPINTPDGLFSKLSLKRMLLVDAIFPWSLC